MKRAAAHRAAAGSARAPCGPAAAMDGIVFPTMTGQEEAQVRRPREQPPAAQRQAAVPASLPLPPPAWLPASSAGQLVTRQAAAAACLGRAARSAAAPAAAIATAAAVALRADARPPPRLAPPPCCAPQAVVNTETEAVAQEGEAPRAGTAHYAVAMPWFAAWCRYSGFTYDARRKRAEVVAQQQPGPRPGPVDNTPLLGQHPVGAGVGGGLRGAGQALAMSELLGWGASACAPPYPRSPAGAPACLPAEHV